MLNLKRYKDEGHIMSLEPPGISIDFKKRFSKVLKYALMTFFPHDEAKKNDSNISRQLAKDFENPNLGLVRNGISKMPVPARNAGQEKRLVERFLHQGELADRAFFRKSPYITFWKSIFESIRSHKKGENSIFKLYLNNSERGKYAIFESLSYLLHYPLTIGYIIDTMFHSLNLDNLIKSQV